MIVIDAAMVAALAALVGTRFKMQNVTRSQALSALPPDRQGPGSHDQSPASDERCDWLVKGR